MTTAGGMGCGLLLMLVGLLCAGLPLIGMFSDTIEFNGVEQPMEGPVAWTFWLMMSPVVLLGLALCGLALVILYSAWQVRGFQGGRLRFRPTSSGAASRSRRHSKPVSYLQLREALEPYLSRAVRFQQPKRV